MRIKLSELRKFLKEAIIPDDNDEIDLADPTVVGSNRYTMDDQETSTKIANRRIKLDPDCADAIEAMEKMTPVLRALMLGEVAPSGWEKAIKRLKKDRKKTGNVKNPWAIAYWMKDKGYKPKQ